MLRSEVEAHVESLNQLVERRSSAFWLVIGVVGVAALLGSTAFVVGVADVIAIIGAAVVGTGAAGAALQHRRLHTLPLELAPVLAVSESARGPELTVRAWLGRGRAVDSVTFDVAIDGASVEVLAVDGPAVGRFQAVFLSAPGLVRVSLVVVAAGKTLETTHTYAIDERSEGRFLAGVQGRPLRFLPGEWGQVATAPSPLQGSTR